MKHLLAVLLLVTPAFATTPVEPLPNYVGNANLQGNITGANVLQCATVPAWYAINGTKLACRWGAAAGSTSGCGIYPDSNGGTALATVSGSTVSAATLSVTGQTINLTAGTRYRICVCSTSTSAIYLEVNDSPATGHLPQMLNAATLPTTMGTGANACTSGAPPSTTGAITGATTFRIPVLLIEE